MRFGTVLVANRGEIAVRVLGAARAAGYATIAVYSDADAGALHVRAADRAIRLGPAAPAESYLHVERILAAAKATGAEAIHPGYGFLSERAAFARAVRDAGLVFLGPPADAIDAMGDKSAAKARMLAAGVPCIPGFHGRAAEDQADERLAAEARKIGFPVMVKAAAGGGGRGMRLVTEDAQLAGALTSARAEATSAFGDGTLLLEKALVSARHVEIQVFGDEHGTIVHFGERDCSVQRRHQKIVEEAPSPAVDDALRAAMGEAAVRAARAVGYVGAGTVELMLAGRDFYFLEMNTRLQVEHPVTELVYDVDLVDLQLRVAQGERIPWTQEQIDARRKGHAIEVRLCAEDAEMRPRTGTVLAWDTPSSVRVDAGFGVGSVVPSSYDSMLAKLIAHGPDRESARRRLLGALASTTVLGVETNRDLLRAILASDVFASGDLDTAFLARTGTTAPALPAIHAALAAIALDLDDAERLRGAAGLAADLVGFQTSSLTTTAVTLERGEATLTLRYRRTAAGHEIADGPVVRARLEGAGTLRYAVGDVEHTARYVRDGDVLWLDAAGGTAAYVDRTYAPVLAAGGAVSGVVAARSDGRVVRVQVAPGDTVKKGQVLVVLESMKMELELLAPIDGAVKAVHVAAGDQVQARRPLVEVA